MVARTKNRLFYALPVVLLVTACMCTSSLPGTAPTLAPPSEVSVTETVATPPSTASEQTAVPTAAPGSFEDFRSFAAGIAAALQAENPSFFYEHASESTWYCLGEESMGVCKDAPADTTLQGTPVTREWDTYTVHSKEKYQERWQATFTEHPGVELAAIAHQFGDNPFMPMASQAFLAILRVPAEGHPEAAQDVRVLFFENLLDTWILRGELVTVEQAWLNNTCSRCYDTWEAWQE